METALRKDALAETYIDIENLIYKLVWRFKARYGGSFDELVAEANLLYILAFDSYSEADGLFSTWVYGRIWHGLQTFLKRITQRNKYGTTFCSLSKGSHKVMNERPGHFHLSDILEEVGQDSKTLIRLVLYPPEGITKDDLEKGFSVRGTRTYLKQYLYQTLGWPKKRIRESFGEIGRILSDGII